MATLEVLTSQGDNLGGQGKFDAAILIHTRVLEVSVRKLGKAHVFTLACGIRLARSFVVSGEPPSRREINVFQNWIILFFTSSKLFYCWII
jgi:hypothetical protein